ncbi:caspase family protein [Actinoplanes couchii]|uniref:Peptidase C14 caspase domain-containing protein n=1 Tax=Actinoplanes couchii TaxID=403638 RepID=A0ABQ3XDR8_9ACTN|nr:caspase family protein [Actinoplanes couchii]MDR6317131.1 hypothetical protein [Actinoplanes couchii]GID56626.1 hypothetical protein Aco03nite_050300 [Actinoplanes couchii]
MARLFVLLIGIDRYLGVSPDLQGCGNDMDLAAGILRDRIAGDDLDLLELCDEQATRDAVISAFRRHLGQAGPDDTALFWFSGHGSTAPLPAELAHTEESGCAQTTVCFDSRTGDIPDLYDKELALLAAEVLAGGCLLVSIMDSCHSRSGMRDPDGEMRGELPPRLAPRLETPPALAALLPGLSRAGGLHQRHIALAACGEDEYANETYRGERPHGAFSWAISRALVRAGQRGTYHDVWSHARDLVTARYRRQSPALEAGDAGLRHREFLGGTLHPPAAAITMRRFRHVWEIDIGTLHGVDPGPQETRLAVHGVTPVREVRVVRAGTMRSTVEPIGWEPVPDVRYRMVLTEVPFPAVAVVTGSARVADDLLRSPHVRVLAAEDGAQADRLLRVDVTGNGDHWIRSADLERLAGPVPVAEVAGQVEHIARWTQIQKLANPNSGLADRVHLEIVPAEPGERVPPAGRPALPPGRVELHYLPDGTPPSVFVRLRNSGPVPLYFVLLDLTDRFRMDADLFDGAFVRGEWAAVAGRGGPITVSLPPDRKAVPGASVTDWLLLLASEEEFSAEPFHLPRLGETSALRSAPGGLRGVLGRLGMQAARREFTVPQEVAADWTTVMVEVRTSVPEGPPA